MTFNRRFLTNRTRNDVRTAVVYLFMIPFLSKGPVTLLRFGSPLNVSFNVYMCIRSFCVNCFSFSFIFLCLFRRLFIFRAYAPSLTNYADNRPMWNATCHATSLSPSFSPPSLSFSLSLSLSPSPSFSLSLSAETLSYLSFYLFFPIVSPPFQ